MINTDRAILYARVSYDDRETEGRNLKSQIEMCKRRALDKGYRVIAALQEDDRGASGAAFELPQLSKIRAMGAKHEFDVLIVREIDRLSRNLAKQLLVEEELKRAGIRIEYVLGEYPDTPEGQLLKLVRASVAEYERLKTIERTARGRLQSAQDGSVMVFNQPPYGYHVKKNAGRFELLPARDEARIVKLIYLWYTAGLPGRGPLSQMQIAAQLNEMKIKPPSHRAEHKNTKRIAPEWRPSTIAKILRTETYAGTWRYNKGQSADNSAVISVPALVDQTVWDAAQAKHQRNKAARAHTSSGDYLMARRLRCGTCGRLLVIAPHNIRKGDEVIKRAYYRCYDSITMAHCKGIHVNTATIDQRVWAELKQYLADPDQLVHKLRDLQSAKATEIAPLQEQLTITMDLLAQNREQLDRVVDLYISGDFDRDMLVERKSRLEHVIASLNEQRASLIAKLEGSSLTERRITAIRELAAEVRPRLVTADNQFAARRQLIEEFAVTGTVKIDEHGQKHLYLDSLLFAGSIAI